MSETVSAIHRAHAACGLLGVTFNDAARAIGRSPAMLRRYLSERNRFPEETRRALAAFFGPHAAFVFGEVDALHVQPADEAR